MDSITKNTAKNTFLLYVMTAAKLVFPLLTLPYLTRVLTTDCYGVVAYVKSCMSYMQIIMDFGFLLSATKDVVKCLGDRRKIGEIVGSVLCAKILLALIVMLATFIMCYTIPILRAHKLFTVLYSLSIVVTAFSMDYLFRGMEKMQLITIVYVVTKGSITLLTFCVVRNDADLLFIPIMEIVGNILGCAIAWLFLKRLKIPIRFVSISAVWHKLKDSAIYFVSSFSSTIFTALNTLLIGIVVKDLEQVAYWSVAWQLVGAVLSLYNPIVDGVYPQMIQKRNLKFIGQILLLIMPIIFLGVIFCYGCAEWILILIAGEEYKNAVLIFRLLIPLFIFAFPSMLFAWPTLGSIGKEKRVTRSTLCGALTQGIGLFLLIVTSNFTIYAVALLRVFTEIVIMTLRLIDIIRYRNLFEVTR